MSRFYLLLLLLILWLIFGSLFLHNRFCGIGAATSEENTTKVIPPVKESTSRLLIEDGSFTTTAREHIDFNQSSLGYLPLTDGVNTSLNKTATYLKDNASRSLLLTGLYKSDEENPSVFENLGIARANEVKKALIGMGVSGNQLLTAGVLTNKDLDENILLSGMNFSFTETTDDLAERLAAIKARFDAKPVTLYFQTGQQNVTLTAQDRKDFSDMVFYLDNTTGSGLEVGGHTDNVGDLNGNKRLSRKRAEFVQEYLTKNGLQANRLSAAGYGPDSPIANNGTREGRSKNRRVEVRLK